MSKALNTFSPYLMVILRLLLGVVFVSAGFNKLGNPDMVIGMLTNMSFPLPQIMGWVLILTEFLGGICLLLGLFTRVVSAPLAFTMLVALLAVHLPKDGVLGMGSFYVTFLMMNLILMILEGARFASLDRLIFKNRY